MGELSPNAQRLVAIGEALHGERWQRSVARDLGVDIRQIGRWARGEYEPSREVVEKLEAIALERIAQIELAIGKRRRKG